MYVEYIYIIIICLRLMYDILKEILKEKEIGLEEFSQTLGITLNTLRRSLQANPTISKIQEIADKLNVHISVFFPVPEQLTQTGDTLQISGFVKVDNDIKEVKSLSDLKSIIYGIEEDNPSK